MKKKILVVCLLIALVLVPATAASYRGASKSNTLGVGLNLGLNSGVGLKFGMGKFDIVSNIGFGVLEADLEVDAEAMYEVYAFDLNRNGEIPVTIGGGAAVNLNLQDIADSSITALFLAGIEYTFKEVPINLYFRAGLGPKFNFNGDPLLGVSGAAEIGALWVFDI